MPQKFWGQSWDLNQTVARTGKNGKSNFLNNTNRLLAINGWFILFSSSLSNSQSLSTTLRLPDSSSVKSSNALTQLLYSSHALNLFVIYLTITLLVGSSCITAIRSGNFMF